MITYGIAAAKFHRKSERSARRDCQSDPKLTRLNQRSRLEIGLPKVLTRSAPLSLIKDRVVFGRMQINVILPLLFTVLFSGFAGVVLGAVITYFFQSRLLNRQLAEQRRIADDKLRLDLFARRYKVYEAAQKFIQIAAWHDQDQLAELCAGTSEAKFLFDADVVDYLEAIRKRALEVQYAPKFYEKMPDGDERTRAIEKEQAARRWLGEQITDITKVFMPYLGFAQITGSPSPQPTHSAEIMS